MKEFNALNSADKFALGVKGGMDKYFSEGGQANIDEILMAASFVHVLFHAILLEHVREAI
jgi:hypothetical protein